MRLIKLNIYCVSFSLFLLIGLASAQEKPDVTYASANTALKSLYETQQWVELYEALKHSKGPALYRGAVAVTFNDNPRQAERLLRSVIQAAPHSDEANQAYEWLAHLYFYTGQYQRLISNMEERWAAFPNRNEVPQERAVMAGFRGLPDQMVSQHRPSTLRHESGSIFIPLTINGVSATYFFDTGAWPSCLTESEAKRFGLTINDTTGSLGTMTTARVGFRTAVAKELIIGNIHFRNVSFVVFPDDQEPWSDLPPGRRGILGIPILHGLRTLRWSKDNTVEIGFKSLSLDVRKANLYFDNDHLVLVAGFQQQKILATLDTGAESTDLYGVFAKEFASFLSASGKQGSTEVRGVGHAESYDSITVPELKFRISGVETVLRPAHILLNHNGAKCCIGNFGLDLLWQAPAFKLDFGAMRLTLEAKQ